MAGKLIGLAISAGLIFSINTFSLIGYSQGSELVKELVSTLKACGNIHVLHDVVFMGGISTFEENELSEIFGNTISGRISNFYSENDRIA